MSSGRQTLAQQLKELHEKTIPSAEIDPENAYSSLSSFRPNDEEDSVARSHYAVAGTSRLRDTAASTFAELGDKYGGSSSTKPKRVKIFDDDPSDDDEEEDADLDAPIRGEFDYMGESSGGEESFAEEDEDDEDEDDDGFEDAAAFNGRQEDEDEEASSSDAEADQPGATHRVEPVLKASSSAPTKALDPLAALKDSKRKDVEKGLAIQRQQKTFDELLTARITLQKAWASGSKLPERKRKAEALEADDVRANCVDCLRSLGQLSDSLLSLREVVSLVPSKRRKAMPKKAAGEYEQTSYWTRVAAESFALLDRSHGTLSSTLDKWSTKIQAAAAQQANLGKANTKFTTTAQVGVIEAIESGLSSRERGADIWQDEDPAYKALLREVIESRSGSGAAAGISAAQSEKKKRRDAERGASKGRKIRYTVHEKAQNFVVPIPLSNGWHQEQVDELFSSLLGGAGMEGAGAEREDGLVMGGLPGSGDGTGHNQAAEVSLSGLRVF